MYILDPGACLSEFRYLISRYQSSQQSAGLLGWKNLEYQEDTDSSKMKAKTYNHVQVCNVAAKVGICDAYFR